ncbi:MAG: hypothetical protein ACYC7D_10395 [Nitrososphaerales archaeon]
MNLKSKIIKRSIPLWAVLVLIVTAGATTSAAMSVGLIPIEHISIFQSQQASSNFNILSQNTQFHGPNKVTVQLKISNTDGSSPHSANVTVSLLDSSGNELLVQAQLTGTVAASSSVTLTYSFSQSGLTNSYGSTFVQVEDSS